MNIFLFEPTGGTGTEILIKLLEQKHQVFVLARNPETYQNELSKCDLVISALGIGASRKPTDIYSKGGQQVSTAMQKANIKRLITLTTGAFDPTDPATRNFIVRYIVQSLFKNIYSDIQKWETILENSKDIDWTIIRPSRLLNGKEKGKYRVQQNYCPKGGSKINRSDLADIVVKQISSNEYIHQKVVIAS